MRYRETCQFHLSSAAKFLGLTVHEQIQKNYQQGFSGVFTEGSTLWLFNIAMKNGLFIDGLPGSLPINSMVIFRGYVA